MTKHYNKSSEKFKRRNLRNNSTYGEKLLWNSLRKKQVADTRFLRQYSIDKFVIDFYCPELHLAIEIDGPTHFESEDKIEYDKARQIYIEKFNIKILRYTDDKVKNNFEEVLKEILEEVLSLKKFTVEK
ncbi:MAG: DUF559 domain-containing protein [Ignavibacteriales bacterium]|nr:MAG: DUF559 domain-containing protein [Ignavibacteriales bacterium]